MPLMKFLTVLFSFSITMSIFAAASKPRADLNIREMTSMQIGSNLYRAIKGYEEIYPFIVIEKVRTSSTEGEEPALMQSWTLNDIEGFKALRPSVEGDDIRDIKWHDQSLEFKFIRSNGNKACKIFKIIEGKPKVSCLNGK